MISIPYELARFIHTLIPFLGNAISMLLGIWVSNMFWKRRIYRYANATIQKTLLFQETQIDKLKLDISEKTKIINRFKIKDTLLRKKAMELWEASKSRSI